VPQVMPECAQPRPGPRRGTTMIVALGRKIFGALLAIAGVGILLTGHWVTTEDMTADLIAGFADDRAGRCDLIDVGFSALTQH
jgi:hypothetical protein